MNTHAAIVTVAPRAPLQVRQVPSPKPVGNEVRVRNEWVTSGPLDLHQADGGFFVTHPQVLGGGVAGTVIEVGEEVKNLKLGDQVFGYGWRSEKEKAHQLFSIMPEYLLAKIPPSISMQQAVTIPTNLITNFHTLTKHFGFPLPWPKPPSYTPPNPDAPILIWGASSSVGQYAIQILHHYAYRTILAVSSSRHHALLKSLGATHVFDYTIPFESLSAQLQQALHGDDDDDDDDGDSSIRYFLDCIGSASDSVLPISRLATTAGAKIAIMIPIIVRDASADVDAPPPLYSADPSEPYEYAAADDDDDGDATAAAAAAAPLPPPPKWADGVQVRGVRTHFYLDNDAFFKQHLQPEIMPELVRQGVIRPNRVRVVEGETMLKRAETALDLLRRRQVRGEKLVWRIAD